MNKPIVMYNLDQFYTVRVGACAIVCPIDHPSEQVSNRNAVHTSTVISHDKETYDFETLNTCYVGVHDGKR